jgi:hypothetical protein
MVIIMIRRFVKLEKEAEFLKAYKAQAPIGNPAFKGETLTRISDAEGIPAGLRGFALNGPACATYLNIAQWDSWEAFIEQFDPNSNVMDSDIETAPRQRAVLNVIAHSPARPVGYSP